MIPVAGHVAPGRPRRLRVSAKWLRGHRLPVAKLVRCPGRIAPASADPRVAVPTPDVMLSGGGGPLGGDEVVRVPPPVNGVRAQRAGTQRADGCQPGAGPSPDPKSSGTWVSDLQPPELRGSTFLLFVSHLVCAPSLQRPERTDQGFLHAGYSAKRFACANLITTQ